MLYTCKSDVSLFSILVESNFHHVWFHSIFMPFMGSDGKSTFVTPWITYLTANLVLQSSIALLISGVDNRHHQP